MIQHQPLIMILIIKGNPSQIHACLGGQVPSFHYIFIGTIEESNMKWDQSGPRGWLLGPVLLALYRDGFTYLGTKSH